MINGTQFICAFGCEALYRAEMITKQADVVAALSIDVLQGTPRAFDRGTTRTVTICSIVAANCIQLPACKGTNQYYCVTHFQYL